MASQEIKLVITGEDKTRQVVLSTENGLKYLSGTKYQAIRADRLLFDGL
jgi:hypothetical protein